MVVENSKIECGRCKTAFAINPAKTVQCPMCGFNKQDVFEGKLPEGRKILKG